MSIVRSSKPRRVEDAAYWSGHIEAHRRSGQKLSEYLRIHGLCRSTFTRWRRRLSVGEETAGTQRSPSPKALRFARVKSAPAAASVPAPTNRCRVELPNGVGIEWPTEADSSALGAIIEATRRWG